MVLKEGNILMRIAITANGPTMDANVDPRFGRCAYFLVVDTDTLETEAVENSNAALGQGAGIQSAQLMATKQVKYVLTGNCGPNAHETLSAAGIGVILNCSGTAREVVEHFKAGQFQASGEANVPGHSGETGPVPPVAVPGAGGGGPDQGRGQGRGGCGRGMGRGMGRGKGGGQGRGRGRGGGQGQGRGRGMGA
jgi:predicted Fe-Mo cluster-binding NifX family protein